MRLHKLQKLIALVLTICISVGCFGVFPAFAATVTDDGVYVKRGESTDPGLTLLYNRDFEDTKALSNGLSVSSSAVNDAMEKVTDGDGNSYVRFSRTGNHDYLIINLDSHSPASGSVVVQFDIMVENDSAYAPGIIQFNPRVRGSSSDVYGLLDIAYPGGKSALQLFRGAVSTDSKMTAGEWYTVTFVWSYTSKEQVTVTAFSGANKTAVYQDTATPDTGCTDVRPGQLRVGVTSALSGNWCLDNLIIYTTPETDPETAANHTVSHKLHGTMFNENAEDYYDPDALLGNYMFKVGVLRGLSASDEQVTLSEAPFKVGGTVYLPVSALTAMGISASRSETVNGIACVALDDIYEATGYFAVYSSMGLIALTENGELSFDGLDTELIPIMQKFIFDSMDADRQNTNPFDVGDMISLEHPYLFANQTRFDELKTAYENPGDDPVLYSYLATLVKRAENVYNGYALNSSGVYGGMKNDYSKMPYQNAYGYDVGGRLGEAASHNERILQLAFGYQITRNDNYARLAYDYAVALGKWEHWGPGHFLNCADASAPYATAYDWLYSAWVGLGLDVKVIEETLFTHSILPAYYSVHDNGCPWYDPVVSSGWGFSKRPNNWNAVCSSGITIASLALVGVTTESAGTLLDIEIDGTYNPTVQSYAGTSGTITRKDGKSFSTDQRGMDTYRDYCEYLVNQCIYNLPYYGMGQYAPDGSYIESNGYWSYGTNNFFEMAAALTTAVGTDFGLLDCWGIDRTCYFAINTQSSDFQSWNYHDSGSVGAQDTSWFQYLALEDGLGDKALAGLRKLFLSEGGGSVTNADAIFYMTDEEIGEFEMPDVQYYMEGIDGYAVRESWEDGAAFAGIMGNTNNLGHGQIDSGAFVYYSRGTRWFCDVGTENYNSYGFWGGNTRYTYYRMNAEGNNTLILTSQQSSVPYGQSLNGFGYMTDTFDNEHGAYSIIDNTSVYGGYADYAYRGMLFTNDRQTLVIQDEVRFSSAQSVAWVGHTMAEVIISVDGKTAYMYDGENVLKVTIVDESGAGLKFEVRDTYDFLLDCTVGPDWSTEHGGQPEYTRDGYRRLVIRAENITELKLAVVIENVDIGKTMNTYIGYSWCDMHDWLPYSDSRHIGTSEKQAVACVTLPDGFDASSLTGREDVKVNTGADCVTAYVYEFATLEELLVNGAVAEIFTSNKEAPIEISYPCVIKTNGFDFRASSVNYIAEVSGDTIEYKTGSVTVHWIVDGSMINEVYTGSVTASYKGTVLPGEIREVDNGDGTYSYYVRGGWAKTQHGAALSEENMTVTSTNNIFYLTDKKFDGIFVTVEATGEITGYYQPSDFFKSHIVQAGYEKVSLTNSFSYDSTGISDTLNVTNLNLYLNGYTLGYDTLDSSDHMFLASGGASGIMNVYGPGEINSVTTQGAIVYGNNGSCYMENVTLTAPRNISDIRAGTYTYKNCTVNITRNTNAFVLNNRNGAVTDPARYPTLILDGCTVNLLSASEATSVFQLWNSSRIKLLGGTNVLSKVQPKYLLALESKLTSSQAGFDFANACGGMQVVIGEIYHSSPELCYSGTGDTSGAVYDYSDKISYTEGALFSEVPGSLKLDTGLVIARVNDSLYPYVAVAEGGCGTVRWQIGDKNCTEMWKSGELPTPDSEKVIALISDSPAPEGKKYSFTTEIVKAGGSHTFDAVLITDFDVKVNMTLHSGFDLNIYVPVDLTGMTVKNFYLDGAPVDISYAQIISIDGVKYYKIVKGNLAPGSCAGGTLFVISCENAEGVNVNITLTVSIPDYAEKVLKSESESDEAKALIINILKYADAAYKYAGNTATPEYTSLRNVYESYGHLATASVVMRKSDDFSAVSDGIECAYLNLDDVPKFRFVLSENYTGDVTFRYISVDSYGNEILREPTYSVVNGTYYGEKYIEIERKAFNITDDITIITASGEAVYSLAAYYHHTAVELGELTDLLNALYAYSETARIYRDSVISK